MSLSSEQTIKTAGLPSAGISPTNVEAAQTAVLSRDAPVLMVYLEPAPYIVGFVEQVRAVWGGKIDVAYVEINRSQPWDYRVQSDAEVILPGQAAVAIREIRRLLASRGYGLLHLAGWGHPVLVAAMLLAKFYDIPVTIESDTPRPSEPATWRSIVKRLVYPWLFSIPKVFLPGGTRQAAYLRDYGVDEARIRVAQMTVDVERIRSHVGAMKSDISARFRNRFLILADTVLVLYLGRLEPHKGIEDLFQSHDLVSQSHPGVSLLVVGDGSLRAVVQAADAASDSICYAGRLSGDEVWEAYCAADIFVLPSRAEPWGLVVNEAMALGLPVIVSDRVGCADDLVQDGITGLVVRAEAPQQLASAIARLVDSPELRGTMGQSASELISGWTLRNQADRTVTAWRHAFG